MFKNKFLLHRFPALLTLAVFCFTETAGAIPSVLSAPLPEKSQGQVPVALFSLPEELGRIESLHVAENRNAPFVALIQDAHAVVDAQKKIRQIIALLNEQYGIQTVALEGAAGHLDPLLFRSFPDKEIKTKIFEDYLSKGELTGSGLNAILGSEGIRYRGIEDWNLYEANYFAYLRAAREKEKVEDKIWDLLADFNRQRINIFSKPLNEFYEQIHAFRSEYTHLLELSQFLRNAGYISDRQIRALAGEYPRLAAFFTTLDLEGRETAGSLNASVREMAEHFLSRYGSQLSRDVLMEFNGNHQKFLAGGMNEGEFLRYLVQMGRRLGISPILTPGLKKILKHADVLASVRGSKFYDELSGFLEDIKKSLIVDGSQQELFRCYESLMLLKDMAALELTREQIDAYRKNPEYYLDLLGEARAFIRPALQFYELALERDRVFGRNITTLLRQTSESSAIFIAGGFHTAGLEQELKDLGYSYAVIMPSIADLEGHENYQSLMHGNLSYKSYLQKSLYEAFSRHAALQLVAEDNEYTFRRHLKEWRDEVIRLLAREGRLHETPDYTATIDQLFKTYREKFQESGDLLSHTEILEALTRELEGFSERTFDAVLLRLKGQLDDFVSGLRDLVTAGHVNPDSVRALAEKVSLQSPAVLHLSNSALVKDGKETPRLIRVLFDPASLEPVKLSYGETVLPLAKPEDISVALKDFAPETLPGLDLKNEPAVLELAETLRRQGETGRKIFSATPELKPDLSDISSALRTQIMDTVQNLPSVSQAAGKELLAIEIAKAVQELLSQENAETVSNEDGQPFLPIAPPVLMADSRGSTQYSESAPSSLRIKISEPLVSGHSERKERPEARPQSNAEDQEKVPAAISPNQNEKKMPQILKQNIKVLKEEIRQFLNELKESDFRYFTKFLNEFQETPEEDIPPVDQWFFLPEELEPVYEAMREAEFLWSDDLGWVRDAFRTNNENLKDLFDRRIEELQNEYRIRKAVSFFIRKLPEWEPKNFRESLTLLRSIMDLFRVRLEDAAQTLPQPVNPQFIDKAEALGPLKDNLFTALDAALPAYYRFKDYRKTAGLDAQLFGTYRPDPAQILLHGDFYLGDEGPEMDLYPTEKDFYDTRAAGVPSGQRFLRFELYMQNGILNAQVLGGTDAADRSSPEILYRMFEAMIQSIADYYQSPVRMVIEDPVYARESSLRAVQVDTAKSLLEWLWNSKILDLDESLEDKPGKIQREDFHFYTKTFLPQPREQLVPDLPRTAFSYIRVPDRRDELSFALHKVAKLTGMPVKTLMNNMETAIQRADDRDRTFLEGLIGHESEKEERIPIEGWDTDANLIAFAILAAGGTLDRVDQKAVTAFADDFKRYGIRLTFLFDQMAKAGEDRRKLFRIFQQLAALAKVRPVMKTGKDEDVQTSGYLYQSFVQFRRGEYNFLKPVDSEIPPVPFRNEEEVELAIAMAQVIARHHYNHRDFDRFLFDALESDSQLLWHFLSSVPSEMVNELISTKFKYQDGSLSVLDHAAHVLKEQPVNQKKLADQFFQLQTSPNGQALIIHFLQFNAPFLKKVSENKRVNIYLRLTALGYLSALTAHSMESHLYRIDQPPPLTVREIRQWMPDFLRFIDSQDQTRTLADFSVQNYMAEAVMIKGLSVAASFELIENLEAMERIGKDLFAILGKAATEGGVYYHRVTDVRNANSDYRVGKGFVNEYSLRQLRPVLAHEAQHNITEAYIPALVLTRKNRGKRYDTPPAAMHEILSKLAQLWDIEKNEGVVSRIGFRSVVEDHFQKAFHEFFGPSAPNEGHAVANSVLYEIAQSYPPEQLNFRELLLTTLKDLQRNPYNWNSSELQNPAARRATFVRYLQGLIEANPEVKRYTGTRSPFSRANAMARQLDYRDFNDLVNNGSGHSEEEWTNDKREVLGRLHQLAKESEAQGWIDLRDSYDELAKRLDCSACALTNPDFNSKDAQEFSDALGRDAQRLRSEYRIDKADRIAAEVGLAYELNPWQNENSPNYPQNREILAEEFEEREKSAAASFWSDFWWNLRVLLLRKDHEILGSSQNYRNHLELASHLHGRLDSIKEELKTASETLDAAGKRGDRNQVKNLKQKLNQIRKRGARTERQIKKLTKQAESLARQAYESDDVDFLKELLRTGSEFPHAFRSDGAQLAILSAALANQRLSMKDRDELYAWTRQIMISFAAQMPSVITDPGVLVLIQNGLFDLIAEINMREGSVAAAWQKVAEDYKIADGQAVFESDATAEVFETFQDQIARDREVRTIFGDDFEMNEAQYLVYADKAFSHLTLQAVSQEERGSYKTRLGLKQIQKDIVRDIQDERIGLGSTSIGKTIVAFVKFGLEHHLARTHGDQISTVTIAETETKAADFVTGYALPKLKLSDRKLKLRIRHDKLAQLFGLKEVINIQELLKDRDYKRLGEALRKEDVHLVIAPDQIGFSAMTLADEQLRPILELFLSKPESFVIEEIDKFLAAQTQFIISDMKNASRFAKEYIAKIQRLFDALHLDFDARGTSSKIERVPSGKGEEALDKFNQSGQERIIIEGEGKQAKAYLSDSLKKKITQDEFELHEIEEALGALVMKFGENFIASLTGELKPVEDGAPQSTHFNGRVTKIILSLVAKSVHDAKRKELDVRIAQAREQGDQATAEKLEKEKAKIRDIDIEALENSLTQATDVSLGIIKDIIAQAQREAVSVNLRQLAAQANLEIIRVGMKEGISRGGGVSLEVIRKDGKEILRIHGRRQTDEIPIEDIPEESSGDQRIPNRNNHILLTQDKQTGELYVRKHIRLTGTTATLSPIARLLIGLPTAFTDRSQFTVGAQQDVNGKVIRAPMTFGKVDASTVAEDIETSEKMLAESGIDDARALNRGRVSPVPEKDVNTIFNAFMTSIRKGWSAFVMLERTTDYHETKRLVEEAGLFEPVIIDEKIAEARKKRADLEKEATRASSPEEQARLQAEVKAADQAIKDAIEAEKDRLEALPKGIHYAYFIDAQSESELIPFIAAIANSKDKAALILTNNIHETMQGIDFDGNFNFFMKSAKRGIRELMQAMGRIVRGADTLGHRYIFAPVGEFEGAKDRVKKFAESLDHALKTILENFEGELEAALREGRTNFEAYEQQIANNEFRYARELLAKLKNNEPLSPLEWFALTATYFYVEKDVTSGILHKETENLKGIGHRLFRKLNAEAQGQQSNILSQAYIHYQNRQKRNEEVDLEYHDRQFVSGARRQRNRLMNELWAQQEAFERAYEGLGGKRHEIDGEIVITEKMRQSAKPLDQIRIYLADLRAAKAELIHGSKKGPGLPAVESHSRLQPQSLLTAKSALETIRIANQSSSLMIAHDDVSQAEEQVITHVRYQEAATALKEADPGLIEELEDRHLVTRPARAGALSAEEQRRWTAFEGKAFGRLMEDLSRLTPQQKRHLESQIPGLPAGLRNALRSEQRALNDSELLDLAFFLAEKGFIDLVEYESRGLDPLLEVSSTLEAANAGKGSVTVQNLYGIFGDGYEEKKPEGRLAVKALELGRNIPRRLRVHLQSLSRSHRKIVKNLRSLKSLELKKPWDEDLRKGWFHKTRRFFTKLRTGFHQWRIQRNTKKLNKSKFDYSFGVRSKRFFFDDDPPPDEIEVVLAMAGRETDPETRAALSRLTQNYHRETLSGLSPRALIELARAEADVEGLIQGLVENDPGITRDAAERAVRDYLPRKAGRFDQSIRPFAGFRNFTAKIFWEQKNIFDRLADLSVKGFAAPSLEKELDIFLIVSALPPEQRNKTETEILNAAQELEKILDRKQKIQRNLADEQYSVSRAKSLAEAVQPLLSFKGVMGSGSFFSSMGILSGIVPATAAGMLLGTLGGATIGLGMGLIVKHFGNGIRYRTLLEAYQKHNQEELAAGRSRPFPNLWTLNWRALKRWFRTQWHGLPVETADLLTEDKSLYHRAGEIFGLSGKGWEAAYQLDQRNWMSRANLDSRIESYIKNRHKTEPLSDEEIKKDYYKRYLKPSETITLNRLLVTQKEFDLSSRDLRDLLIAYVPELSEKEAGVIVKMLGSLTANADLYSLKFLTVKEFLESLRRVESIVQTEDAEFDHIPSVLRKFENFEFSPLEKILWTAFAHPDLPAEQMTHAGSLELMAPLFESYGVTDPVTGNFPDVRKILEFLAGQGRGDFLEKNRDLLNRWDGAEIPPEKPLSRVDLIRIYESALAAETPESDRLPLLREGLARVRLTMAHHYLIEDASIDKSFKGMARHWLDLAGQEDTMRTRVEKLKTRYGVNAEEDFIEPKEQTITVEALMANRMNQKELNAYRNRIQTIIDSQPDMVHLKEKFDRGGEDRKEAIREIVRGLNAYQGTKQNIDPDKVQDLEFQVVMASEDPYLSEAWKLFGLPNVPVAKILVGKDTMEYLRGIEFFTETGAANATRPGETSDPFHVFSRSGYIVVQKGNEEMNVGHELKHLVDINRPAGTTTETRIDTLLLNENEAYHFQKTGSIAQSNGEDYDEEAIDNPLYSYAMDQYKLEEKAIRAQGFKQVWLSLHAKGKSEANLTESQKERLNRDLHAYLQRQETGQRQKIKNRVREFFGKKTDSEIDAQVEDEIGNLIEDMDTRKSRKIARMRMMRAAMRRLDRYLTPQQVFFIASTAKTLDDIIGFLYVEESDLVRFGSEADSKETNFEHLFRNAEAGRAESRDRKIEPASRVPPVQPTFPARFPERRMGPPDTSDWSREQKERRDQVVIGAMSQVMNQLWTIFGKHGFGEIQKWLGTVSYFPTFENVHRIPDFPERPKAVVIQGDYREAQLGLVEKIFRAIEPGGVMVVVYPEDSEVQIDTEVTEADRQSGIEKIIQDSLESIERKQIPYVIYKKSDQRSESRYQELQDQMALRVLQRAETLHPFYRVEKLREKELTVPETGTPEKDERALAAVKHETLEQLKEAGVSPFDQVLIEESLDDLYRAHLEGFLLPEEERAQYHNLRHTLEVLKETLRIAKIAALHGELVADVALAAIYHDIAVIRDGSKVYARHESLSATYAGQKLHTIAKKRRDRILRFILGTQFSGDFFRKEYIFEMLTSALIVDPADGGLQFAGHEAKRKEKGEISPEQFEALQTVYPKIEDEEDLRRGTAVIAMADLMSAAASEHYFAMLGGLYNELSVADRHGGHYLATLNWKSIYDVVESAHDFLNTHLPARIEAFDQELGNMLFTPQNIPEGLKINAALFALLQEIVTTLQKQRTPLNSEQEHFMDYSLTRVLLGNRQVISDDSFKELQNFNRFVHSEHQALQQGFLTPSEQVWLEWTLEIPRYAAVARRILSSVPESGKFSFSNNERAEDRRSEPMFLKKVSEEDRRRILQQTEIHGTIVYEGHRLTAEVLERLEMGPAYQYETGGRNWFFSNAFDVAADHLAIIAYEEKREDDGRLVYVPRTYYQSRSGVLWRFLPRVRLGNSLYKAQVIGRDGTVKEYVPELDAKTGWKELSLSGNTFYFDEKDRIRRVERDIEGWMTYVEHDKENEPGMRPFTRQNQAETDFDEIREEDGLFVIEYKKANATVRTEIIDEQGRLHSIVYPDGTRQEFFYNPIQWFDKGYDEDSEVIIPELQKAAFEIVLRDSRRRFRNEKDANLLFVGTSRPTKALTPWQRDEGSYTRVIQPRGQRIFEGSISRESDLEGKKIPPESLRIKEPLEPDFSGPVDEFLAFDELYSDGMPDLVQARDADGNLTAQHAIRDSLGPGYRVTVKDSNQNEMTYFFSKNGNIVTLFTEEGGLWLFRHRKGVPYRIENRNSNNEILASHPVELKNGAYEATLPDNLKIIVNDWGRLERLIFADGSRHHFVYGAIDVTVLDSKNKENRYLYMEDKWGRAWAWTGKAGLSESLGLMHEWVDAGDFSIPAFEYAHMASREGNWSFVRAGYVDMWRHYLSDIRYHRQFKRRFGKRPVTKKEIRPLSKKQFLPSEQKEFRLGPYKLLTIEVTGDGDVLIHDKELGIPYRIPFKKVKALRPIRFGRLDTNEVVIEDKEDYVSRVHAELTFALEENRLSLWLEDLNTLNGTYDENNRKIAEKQKILEHNLRMPMPLFFETVQVGRHSLHLNLKGQELGLTVRDEVTREDTVYRTQIPVNQNEFSVTFGKAADHDLVFEKPGLEGISLEFTVYDQEAITFKVKQAPRLLSIVYDDREIMAGGADAEEIEIMPLRAEIRPPTRAAGREEQQPEYSAFALQIFLEETLTNAFNVSGYTEAENPQVEVIFQRPQNAGKPFFVTIRDNGPGFDEQQLRAAAEYFYGAFEQFDETKLREKGDEELAIKIQEHPEWVQSVRNLSDPNHRPNWQKDFHTFIYSMPPPAGLKGRLNALVDARQKMVALIAPEFEKSTVPRSLFQGLDAQGIVETFIQSRDPQQAIKEMTEFAERPEWELIKAPLLQIVADFEQNINNDRIVSVPGREGRPPLYTVLSTRVQTGRGLLMAQKLIEEYRMGNVTSRNHPYGDHGFEVRLHFHPELFEKQDEIRQFVENYVQTLSTGLKMQDITTFDLREPLRPEHISAIGFALGKFHEQRQSPHGNLIRTEGIQDVVFDALNRNAITFHRLAKGSVKAKIRSPVSEQMKAAATIEEEKNQVLQGLRNSIDLMRDGESIKGLDRIFSLAYQQGVASVHGKGSETRQESRNEKKKTRQIQLFLSRLGLIEAIPPETRIVVVHRGKQGLWVSYDAASESIIINADKSPLILRNGALDEQTINRLKSSPFSREFNEAVTQRRFAYQLREYRNSSHAKGFTAPRPVIRSTNSRIDVPSMIAERLNEIFLLGKEYEKKSGLAPLRMTGLIWVDGENVSFSFHPEVERFIRNKDLKEVYRALIYNDLLYHDSVLSRVNGNFAKVSVEINMKGEPLAIILEPGGSLHHGVVNTRVNPSEGEETYLHAAKILFPALQEYLVNRSAQEPDINALQLMQEMRLVIRPRRIMISPKGQVALAQLGKNKTINEPFTFFDLLTLHEIYFDEPKLENDEVAQKIAKEVTEALQKHQKNLPFYNNRYSSQPQTGDWVLGLIGKGESEEIEWVVVPGIDQNTEREPILNFHDKLILDPAVRSKLEGAVAAFTIAFEDEGKIASLSIRPRYGVKNGDFAAVSAKEAEAIYLIGGKIISRVLSQVQGGRREWHSIAVNNVPEKILTTGRGREILQHFIRKRSMGPNLKWTLSEIAALHDFYFGLNRSEWRETNISLMPHMIDEQKPSVFSLIEPAFGTLQQIIYEGRLDEKALNRWQEEAEDLLAARLDELRAGMRDADFASMAVDLAEASAEADIRAILEERLTPWRSYISDESLDNLTNRINGILAGAFQSTAETLAFETLALEPWFLDFLEARLGELDTYNEEVLNLVIPVRSPEFPIEIAEELTENRQNIEHVTLLLDPAVTKLSDEIKKTGLVFTIKPYEGLARLSRAVGRLREQAGIHGKEPVFAFHETLPDGLNVTFNLDAIVADITKIPASQARLKKIIVQTAVRILSLLRAAKIRNAGEPIAEVRRILEQKGLGNMMDAFSLTDGSLLTGDMAKLVDTFKSMQEAMKSA